MGNNLRPVPTKTPWWPIPRLTYAERPHAPGDTILGEILVVAEHDAYPIGEFAMGQMMSTWPVDR
jgi:hypothetical protein